MRKINTLFSDSLNNGQSELRVLAQNVHARQHLQAFWQAAAPQILSQSSYVSGLNQGEMTVYADSAIVANKIKFIHSSLLTQLQNLQKNNPFYGECKVTAIKVKVQVKSRQKTVIKTPRKLSTNAANSLKNLAENLLSEHKGNSPLAEKLKHLANKT